MTERIPPERGAATLQGTRRVLRGQHGMWDEDPATAQAPPPYRIARASLPVQERRRQQPPQGGVPGVVPGRSHAIHPEDQPYVTDERGSGGLIPSRVPTHATSAIDEGQDDRPARTSTRRYHRSMTAVQQTAPVARRRPLHGSVYIGLTLDGHLSVIEMQGGDLSKTVIYAGPVIYEQGSDLVAVTLSIAHDQNGKPELVLHYQSNEVILYDGKDGKFHLQPQQ